GIGARTGGERPDSLVLALLDRLHAPPEVVAGLAADRRLALAEPDVGDRRVRVVDGARQGVDVDRLHVRILQWRRDAARQGRRVGGAVVAGGADRREAPRTGADDGVGEPGPDAAQPS